MGKDLKIKFKELKYYTEYTYTGSTPRAIAVAGVNITALNCSSNELTALDVSKNTKLISLNCQDNRLTA